MLALVKVNLMTKKYNINNKFIILDHKFKNLSVRSVFEDPFPFIYKNIRENLLSQFRNIRI